MTNIPPWDDTKLPPFYRSAPTPCPYLKGRMEQKLFTQAIGKKATFFNSLLTSNGFRRSHDIIYRPDCSGCNECVAVRIPVARFESSRSMRRVSRMNRDLFSSVSAPAPTESDYDLFMRYQQNRHGDSEMAHMSLDDFKSMMVEGNVSVSTLSLFTQSKKVLLGTILFDLLLDGVSAVYSYYDPLQAKRSLGTELILRLIDHTKQLNLEYVYLGYWISSCRKMNYKTKFRPLEALTDDGWVDFDKYFDQQS